MSVDWPSVQEAYEKEFDRFVTVESWNNEPYVRPMYDIIDGRRLFLPWRSHAHNSVRANLALAIRETRRERMYISILPCDIQIVRDPLTTRRPDLFILSLNRIGCSDPDYSPPLGMCPDLVIEILDYTETEESVAPRMADYWSISVLEFWLADLSTSRITVFDHAHDGWSRVREYGVDETVTSISLPSVSVKVSDVFDLDD